MSNSIAETCRNGFPEDTVWVSVNVVRAEALGSFVSHLPCVNLFITAALLSVFVYEVTHPEGDISTDPLFWKHQGFLVLTLYSTLSPGLCRMQTFLTSSIWLPKPLSFQLPKKTHTHPTRTLELYISYWDIIVFFKQLKSPSDSLKNSPQYWYFTSFFIDGLELLFLFFQWFST